MSKLTIDRERQAMLDRHHMTSCPAITDEEAEQMLHALGADDEPYKKYRDSRTYHAYRNYYDAGGDDVAVWDGLVSKGLAVKGRTYHVTVEGIHVLGILTGCRIYDARRNVADCRDAVLERMVEHDMRYGYRVPLPAATIAEGLAIPVALARKTLNRLADEGLVKKHHFGGRDGVGRVHCSHGWACTAKARKLYSVSQKPLGGEDAGAGTAPGRTLPQEPSGAVKEEGGPLW